MDNALDIGWIGVGQAGVWGLHFPPAQRAKIYYLQGTYGDNRPSAYMWQLVSERMFLIQKCEMRGRELRVKN